MKKNCHNCIHGYWDAHFDEITTDMIEGFICEKRDPDENKNLEADLDRPEFLEKAKRCCELPV